MEKNFYTVENIEAYLENKLSPSQKALFEDGLAKDPLLQNEVELQHDIIQSLKAQRKVQLKNRLNNIEIGTGGGSLVGIKIAASVVVSGLIGLGIYSYFNKTGESKPVINNQVSVVSKTEEVKTTATKTIAKENTENISVTNTELNNVNSVTQKEESKNTNIDSKIKNKKKISTLNITESKNETINQNIIENIDNDMVIRDENGNLPDSRLTKNPDLKVVNTEVQVEKTDKKFHYRYFDNKLYLYGNFEDKTYEIIELHPAVGGKQVYLYYDKNYYQLDPNQLDATQLNKITDNKLIQDLNKLNK